MSYSHAPHPGAPIRTCVPNDCPERVSARSIGERNISAMIRASGSGEAKCGVDGQTTEGD